jgi:hypothetical protein
MPMRRWLRLAGATAIAAAVAGCALSTCPGSGAAPALVVELLFGRSLHGGGEVTDAQWRDFLADTVTPRFPDGLTALDGAGQWRMPESGRIESERSKVLLIVAEDTPQTRQRLEEVRDIYRARFAQQSVGLIAAPACAAF